MQCICKATARKNEQVSIETARNFTTQTCVPRTFREFAFISARWSCLASELGSRMKTIKGRMEQVYVQLCAASVTGM